MEKLDKILSLSLIVGFLVSFLIVIQKPLYVDEITHFSAISNFCKFNFSFPDFLTTIPGYHFFGGLFGALTDCTEGFIRFFNLLASFAAIIVFFYLAKEIAPKNYKEKSLLFSLLPILFPFFFLIYTDVLSLLFVLLMFYSAVKEKYALSGIFGLLSFVVRQNNIIWVLFVGFYLFFGLKGNLSSKLRKSFSAGFVKNILPYVAVLVIAGVLFAKMGGFALGDRAQHPTFFIGPMNIFTLLFFFFWINLPENVLNSRKIFSKISSLGCKKIAALIAIFTLFYIFFMLTFRVDHVYNNYEIYHYFLRNKILHLFDSSAILRSAFFLCALYASLSLAVTKFKEKRQHLVYLFSGLFLALSWLIENRYFIVPFVLINLFALREKKVERYLIIWYLLITVVYMFWFLGGWTFW